MSNTDVPTKEDSPVMTLTIWSVTMLFAAALNVVAWFYPAPDQVSQMLFQLLLGSCTVVASHSVLGRLALDRKDRVAMFVIHIIVAFVILGAIRGSYQV